VSTVGTRTWLCAAVAVVIAVAVAADGASAVQVNQPRLSPCEVSSVPARCGQMSVYENRATGAGRTIELQITVVPATSTPRQPDPIFWLAGGPGDAATESAANVVQFLGAANLFRDLVFVDQRGTGGSNQLFCPQSPDELRACLSTLDADGRAYTTAWAMDDLDDVRSALGYRTVNLIGGSYGVTAAQVYLQRHPSRVRSATMLSGTPLDVPIFERFPASSQQAMDRIFARCAADDACHAAFPDPVADLRAVTARLDRGPVDLPATDPTTNRPAQFRREDLAAGLHALLRDTQTAPLLPLILHAAAAGDWQTVLDVAPPTSPDDSPGWRVMGLTILCHEPWAVLRPARTDAARSYLGYVDVRAMTVPENICAVVPRPEPAALYGPSVPVAVPTLWLNGDADPQDPPENLVGLHHFYPTSEIVIMPGQAHSYAGTDCLRTIITTFVRTASTAGLESECMAETLAPSFRLG
jgi:pimeloyl-ACP methyl ester carboxylesterase